MTYCLIEDEQDMYGYSILAATDVTLQQIVYTGTYLECSSLYDENMRDCLALNALENQTYEG